MYDNLTQGKKAAPALYDNVAQGVVQDEKASYANAVNAG